ncbi:MAG TPA: CusA/CzcA family heavy metal efflux RND transporter [Cellvibrio sp.]|nr:CusA/CzcA family heavy metal efflux RND transporter [Cellvibrio sp.]
MLNSVISWSLRNNSLVIIAAIALTIGGLYALLRTPLDALPDLADAQVILYSEYPGQAPQQVEDQVSYPLVNAMLGVPKARTVRGFSFFGVSFVYIIFADGTDLYWARSRVQEALSQVAGKLPAQVSPRIGPDASSIGWVYQYALQSSQLNLAQARSLQDYFIRGQLSKTPGVAEVASIGGTVWQYQVIIDPLRLRALNIELPQISAALANNNQNTGARSIELSETEIVVRGQGYLRSAADINNVIVENRNGAAIRISDLARVEMGTDERRGIGELNGQGEAVSGIVVARTGENVLDVIEQTKEKIKELALGLPADVKLLPVYDRSTLIHNAIQNLSRNLLEESVIVALVCLVFLLHVRSALVAIITLPLAILMAFIVMRGLGLGANIMSLGGIAIAIGAMVDAAIVMIENVHKHLERASDTKPRQQVILQACSEVGPALFFSLLIITLSFLPVLALSGQEGKLFSPLAITKSLAMAAAALLSITLIPVLILLFIRGKLRAERNNPINNFLIRIYRPCLDMALRHKTISLLFALLLAAASYWPYSQLGREFMPELNEGTLLYMPTAQPGISVTQAAQLLHNQDKIIKSFPEVASVYGKAGRANTATDPAPLEMFETLIQLKPEREWRAGVTIDSLIAEMDQALQLPGIANAWTMPIKARIDMLATGIRTPLGIKLFGSDLAELERLSRALESALKTVPGTSSAYAERLSGSPYLSIKADPHRLALYGLSQADVQQALATAIGGEIVTSLVQGRERIAVNLRYSRDWRSDPTQIARELLIKTNSDAQVPLGQVAQLELEYGSPGIRSENGLLSSYIFIDIQGRDLGSYVAEANQIIQKSVQFPSGYYSVWSGQFEHMERAYQRLALVVPLTLALIFALLWLNFRRLGDSLIIFLSVPFALVGGIWLVWLLDYNLSVAVIIGFIALAGVATETGVVMLLYLNQAWQKLQVSGQPLNAHSLYSAIIEGAVERVRPKMMTVCAIIAGLLPILWSHGAGHEIMRRIAAPMVGGMVSSCILTLLVIPVLYALLKQQQLQSPAVK